VNADSFRSSSLRSRTAFARPAPRSSFPDAGRDAVPSRGWRLYPRALSLLERWLGHERAVLGILALTALTLAPAIAQGFFGDDFFRNAVQDGSKIGFGSAPFDLFAFSTGQAADHARLQAEGIIPWWADPSTKVHFFRPLTSLTHALDHRLWPNNPRAEHAQNVLWFLGLVAAVWLMLSRSRGPRWIATFALLLFAIDETHGGAIGWISSRNGIMCTLFGVLALWAHDRWRRDGWRPGSVLGPLSFAVGLGCGEACVATLGYLAAHAFFLDRGTVRARALRLAPYGALVAVLGVIYAVGGYGASAGVSGYINPISEPWHYLRALAARLPVFLHALLAGPSADGWNIYPMLHPAMQPAMWVLAALTVAGFLWFVRPVLAGDREGQFWLTGSVLAVAPACAGYPQDRILLFSSIGLLVVVARFIVAVGRDREALYAGRRVKRFLATGMAGWLFFASVPLSVPALTLRAVSQESVQKTFVRADESIPDDPSIEGKTLVLMNPPIEPLVFSMHHQRAARNAFRPAETRLLATSGGHALLVERVDDFTLRISNEEGILSRAADMFMRKEGHDLLPGSAVSVPGMRVEIESVTSDGRPASACFRFEHGLDDPALLWMDWDGHGFRRFTPPAAGAPVHLPAQNLVDFFMGK
jgi:hypothetical protein